MKNGKGAPKWNQKTKFERQFLAKAGARLRRKRIDAGLTLEQLGEKIGTPTTVLNRFECGKGVIGLHKLAKACAVFECSADEILGVMTYKKKEKD